MPAAAAVVGVDREVDTGAVANRETRIARDAAHTDTAGGDPVLRRGRADIIAGAAMVGVSLEVDTGVAAIRESRIIARGGAHASIAAGGPV